MTTRAVLFDWTGTLAYRDRSRSRDPVAALAAALGGSATGERQLRQVLRDVMDEHGDAISVDALVEQTAQRLGLDTAPGTLERATNAFAAAVMSGQELYDDARAMIASLRYRGYRLAIVSNLVLSAEHLRDHLQACSASGYFDAIVTSADTGAAKPHPAPFLRALELLQVTADEALAVGDSEETDIVGARAAGIPAVLLDRREHGRRPAAIGRLTGLNALLGEGPAPVA